MYVATKDLVTREEALVVLNQGTADSHELLVHPFNISLPHRLPNRITTQLVSAIGIGIARIPDVDGGPQSSSADRLLHIGHVHSRYDVNRPYSWQWPVL